MRIWFSLSALLVSMALSAFHAYASDALDLLEKASEAASKLNYSGTYFYRHGDHSEVLRVFHRAGRRGELQKVEVLDGPHREFLRIDDEIYCHMADGKTVRIDKHAIQRFFPAVVPDDAANLARFYLPKFGGSDRVAGRDCLVLILEPRDQYRYAHMLWLDRQTFLPLKTRTVDPRGSTVSMFAFSEIEIGNPPDMAIFDVHMAGKQITAASLSPIPQALGDWIVNPPSGYSIILEALRPMPGKKMPVLHRVYSDGMSNLSLFIEPLVDDATYLEGLSTEGPINIYARRLAEYKVTAIGEVPAAALLQTANSVRKK